MRSILFFFLLVVGKSAAKVTLGSLIPLCDIKSSDLNDCVVKSANLMIPVMAKGIKGYGFPPLDPLFVPRMDVGQSNGPVNLKLELVNSTHYGLGRMNFRSASINPKKYQWILNGTIPDYSVKGRYKAKGRILLVPMVGDGDASLNFLDIGVDFVINGAPKIEKGNEYFDLKNLRVYFKFRKNHVSFSNLFNGNRELGEVSNRFLNENSNEVVAGLKDSLEDIYSDLYTNLLKRITSKTPLNEMFKNA